MPVRLDIAETHLRAHFSRRQFLQSTNLGTPERRNSGTSLGYGVAGGGTRRFVACSNA